MSAVVQMVDEELHAPKSDSESSEELEARRIRCTARLKLLSAHKLDTSSQVHASVCRLRHLYGAVLFSPTNVRRSVTSPTRFKT